MNMQLRTTAELLAELVGKQLATKLAKVPLSNLFELQQHRPIVAECQAEYAPIPALTAARELITRALAENLRSTPITLSSPKAVKDYLRLTLGNREQEVFVVLFLNTQHHVIAVEELFQGTLTQTSVYPREVVKRALANNAAAVLLAHNHPSGFAEPSQADKALTVALKQALALVDVKVLDHFVIGEHEALSFAEWGLM